MAITASPIFTLDLEVRTEADRTGPRLSRVVDEVLGFLADRGAGGTFFVVGHLAEERPDLVGRIAEAGHEVGLHGHEHRLLAELGPTEFEHQCTRGKRALEDAAGADVVGFRAPFFSLVRETPWAPDVIQAAGFRYSSSVLPARNPIAGFPGAPQEAFRWRNGLVELPCPLAGVGPARVPFLGGVYLRVLPRAVVRACLRRRRATRSVLWTYCHPYDFDAEEPFHVLEGTSRLQSRLLWRNRAQMFDRLSMVLAFDGGQALRDVACDPAFAARLPVFDWPS